MVSKTVTRSRLTNWALTGAAWLTGVVVAAPIIWTVMTSFKTERSAVSNPPTVVFRPVLDGYRKAFEDAKFTRAILNSGEITVVAVVMAVLIGYPIAYALTIRPIRRRAAVLFLLVTTRIMPIPAAIFPFFTIVRMVDLFDSPVPLMWIYGAANAPLAVWMLRSYLRDIPSEVVDAAAVDGARPVQVSLRIVTPMVIPSIAAVSVLIAVFAWIEFFIAVSLTAYDAVTLPAFLAGFISGKGLYIGQLSAVSVITIIPIVTLGFVVQKPLMRGFANAVR